MRLLLCLLLLQPELARAAKAVAPDPPSLCEAAISGVERSGRLPPGLLTAISLTETGRRDSRTGTLRSWPWTIDAEGAGQFLATGQAAIAAVQALQARGVRSIDVGCMQINLMHHPKAFCSLQDAFEPSRNVLYAAHFLETLKTTGDWLHAIAAYHSDTPALGAAYRLQVLARWHNPDLQNVRTRTSAYQDFARDVEVYAAFAPRRRAYAAFAPQSPPGFAPGSRIAQAFKASRPDQASARTTTPAQISPSAPICTRSSGSEKP